MMGAVVFSHTGCSPGVLKTLAVITGHHPVRPGAHGIDGGRGHETCQAILAIRCLTEGQKSNLVALTNQAVAIGRTWKDMREARQIPCQVFACGR
jgi:hypothetical protein